VADPQGARESEVREAIRDALAGISSDSAAVNTKDGGLAVVFFDSDEAYLVTVQQAGLMVLRG